MAPSFFKSIGKKFDQIFGKTTHSSEELIDNFDRSWSGRARSGPLHYTGPIDKDGEDDEDDDRGRIVDYSGVPYSYTVEGAEGSLAQIRGTNSSSVALDRYPSKRDSASSFDKDWNRSSRPVRIGEGNESLSSQNGVNGTCSTQGPLGGSREYIVDGDGLVCRKNSSSHYKDDSSVENKMQTPTEESFQHVVDSAEDVVQRKSHGSQGDGKLVFDASVATDYLYKDESNPLSEEEDDDDDDEPAIGKDGVDMHAGDDAAWNSTFVKRWKAERRKARLQAMGVRSLKDWDNSTQSLNEIPELLVNELPERRREREDKEFDRDPSLATLLLRDAEVC
mmetsp:Transcript_4750/g.9477  ORF Transcript_4750/g.9477 Transcript_4750/m.9477 type:complete len:335 (+) Transcript_4750:302-1306(+)